MGALSTAAMIGIGATIGGTTGLASGLINNKNLSAQAEGVQRQAEYTANERIRQADKLQQQQTVGFLKSGVFLEGTPELVLEETKQFALEDVRQIFRESEIQSKALLEKGRLGIFTSTIGGALQGGFSGFRIGNTLGGIRAGYPRMWSGNLLD